MEGSDEEGGVALLDRLSNIIKSTDLSRRSSTMIGFLSLIKTPVTTRKTILVAVYAYLLLNIPSTTGGWPIGVVSRLMTTIGSGFSHVQGTCRRTGTCGPNSFAVLQL